MCYIELLAIYAGISNFKMTPYKNKICFYLAGRSGAGQIILKYLEFSLPSQWHLTPSAQFAS